MVKLNKRPNPPAPILSENDYRTNPNFAAIVEDCYSKCYICENDKATTLNIEHLISHKGNNTLKYDWNNLLLACGHCNSIKGGRFDNILNPTECDPEDFIALTLTTESFVEKVIVEALSEDENILQTADLLRLVYNGGTTAIKEIECTTLRNLISENIVRFLLYIKGYYEEPELNYEALIQKEISKSSAFAAFKRKIIREDEELSAKFALPQLSTLHKATEKTLQPA